MKISFEVAVEFREEQGKGASRRLRHEGKVPAIMYGGNKEPRALSLNHNKLTQLLDNEKFYTSIVALKIGEHTQNAVVRDLQRHPYKPQIVHIDFQRVLDDAGNQVQRGEGIRDTNRPWICEAIRQSRGIGADSRGEEHR